MCAYRPGVDFSAIMTAPRCVRPRPQTGRHLSARRTASPVVSDAYLVARRLLLRHPMTAPRPVFPGQILLIHRRCTQRQYLLRPDEETNNAFTYLLADAS